jgi:hypothetical protein
MAIPTQLDNLSVRGMANGAIGLFANVFAGLQTKYGTNASGWVNAINDLDDIIYADHLRVTGLDSITTSKYQSEALANNRTYFSDRSNVDYIKSSANINVTSGVIVPHYYASIPSKDFSNASVVSSNTLQNFINTTLNDNTTFANLNVTSSKDYAINNGYVNSYTNLDSGSFNTATVLPTIQTLAETRLATLKSAFVNNRIID